MPLAKRSVAPAHLCQAALPEGISSELECVTNATLSAIIRQLSSLSKQAEDVFGELFSEANTFHLRANTLQDRIERLTYKVTQLDSGIEEVSLQDINMRKAFRSATVQDQQVVSKSTIPNCVAEAYNKSDKPPSLNILSAYRDDHIEGMKFYTDPSYFFHLWKDKMFQDTEDKREEKRRQQEQKLSMDRTMSPEIIKVHKAHNCHQQWNTMALDMELRRDHCSPKSIHQGASSERNLSTEAITHCPDMPNYPVPVYHTQAPSIQGQQPPFMTPPPPEDGALDSLSAGAEHEYHIIGGPLDMAVGAGAPIGYNGGAQGLTHLPPTQHPPPGGGANGKITHSPAESGLTNSHSPLPSIMAFYTSTTLPSHFIPQTPVPPLSQPGPISSALSYPLPSDPPCGPTKAPPPSVAPPPLALAVSPHSVGVGKGACQDSQPITEERTDLLSAIRMGIQLKKVKEHHQHQAKRECLGNDVATILSRRIAVEYSDSGDDSELHGNEWSD